jgi:hypothetical protein
MLSTLIRDHMAEASEIAKQGEAVSRRWPGAEGVLLRRHRIALLTALALQSVAQALPLTPVVELMRLGLTGTAADGHHLGLAASFGAAASPVLVLAAWIAAGAWAARRWFRWEPRR